MRVILARIVCILGTMMNWAVHIRHTIVIMGRFYRLIVFRAIEIFRYISHSRWIFK